MWGLPGPGLEPVSLALAGRFLTATPPGKPEGVSLSSGKQHLGGQKPRIIIVIGIIYCAQGLSQPVNLSDLHRALGR